MKMLCTYVFEYSHLHTAHMHLKWTLLGFQLIQLTDKLIVLFLSNSSGEYEK